MDTSNYSNVEIRLSNYLDGAGHFGDPRDNLNYVHTSNDGGTTWVDMATGLQIKKGQWNAYNSADGGVDVTAAGTATGTSTTTFRINQTGAASNKPAAAVMLDDVTILGCPRPVPPTLAKSFSPTTIGTDTTDETVNTTVHYSTLTFTIANPQAIALTGVTFSDTLPTGLVVANPPTVSAISCTSGTLAGTINATAGSDTISLTGGSLAVSAAGCTFSVRVQGTKAGSYTNTTNAIKADYAGSNTGGANVGYGSAPLTVVDPPVVSKAFGASSLLTNGTTTLTFSLCNPNAASLTGVQFSNSLGVATPDTLPSGLVVGTPANVSAVTCNDGGSLTGQTITAEGNTIALTNGTLSAGATCYFTVDVKSDGSSTGIKTNSVQVSATETGTGNTSTANILVKDQVSALKLLKQVGMSSSGPWSNFLTVPTPLPQNVYFQFTVENTGDTALTNVRVNDLTIPGLDLSNCTSVLTSGLALYETKTCISGAVYVTTGGAYANTANATSDAATSANSTARYATAGLVLIKSVSESSFSAAEDLLHYSYLVYNNGSTSLAGPVTVSDDKSTDETCPAVTTVGNYDANLDPGEGITCTATYTVLAGDVAAGFVTNSATATADEVNSNTDSRTVYSNLPDLRVAKTDNTSGAVGLPNSFTWTLTATNNGPVDATFEEAQVILRDLLPANATYGTPTAGNFTNIANSGNISCSIDSSNILTCTVSGDPVTIGGTTGSFEVTLPVTPTAIGSLANTVTVDPDNNVTESIETNNTGSNTVVVSIPTAVDLTSFAATPARDSVTLAWETVSGPIGQAVSHGWLVGLVGFVLVSAAAMRWQRKQNM